MHWQRGFKRLRTLAAAALACGVVLLLCVILTQVSGYAPDPAFAPLYAAFWPLGLMLLVLGVLLWLAVWVLMGFVPENSSAPDERTRQL